MASLTLDELLRAFEKRLARRFLFHAQHVYRVTEQVGDRLSLKSVGSTDGLEDELVLDKAHGLAGAREICAPGSLVLVGFRNGKRGEPFVAAYLATGGASTPLEAEVDATTEVRVGPSAEQVALAGGDRPLAMGDEVTTYLATVHVLLGEIVLALAPAAMSPLAVAAAAEVTAYVAATFSAERVVGR